MSTVLRPPPAQSEREARRARLAVVAAVVGIAATLLAYGLAPGVRHAVGHAAHSVKHAVSHVLDPDAGSSHRHSAHAKHGTPVLRVTPGKAGHAGAARDGASKQASQRAPAQ